MTHQRQSPQQLIGEQYSYHLLHWMVMLWLLLELLLLPVMQSPSRSLMREVGAVKLWKFVCLASSTPSDTKTHSDMMASVAGASGASTSGAKGGSGSLACDLSGKYFQGVLNGLMRGFVLREEGISLDFIRDSLFTASSMPPAGTHTLTARLLAQHLLCVYGTDLLCMRLVFVFVFMFV